VYHSLAKIDLFLQLRLKNHENFHNFSIFYNQTLVFFKIGLYDTNSYPLLLESIHILKVSNLFILAWSLKINSDTLYLIVRSQYSIIIAVIYSETIGINFLAFDSLIWGIKGISWRERCSGFLIPVRFQQISILLLAAV
jgi:hypothetical protein